MQQDQLATHAEDEENDEEGKLAVNGEDVFHDLHYATAANDAVEMQSSSFSLSSSSSSSSPSLDTSSRCLISFDFDFDFDLALAGSDLDFGLAEEVVDGLNSPIVAPWPTK